MAVPTHQALYKLCQGFPHAIIDHPWGDTVFKVKHKIFVFASNLDRPLSVTVKIPRELRELWSANANTYTPAYVGRFGWIGIHIVDDETWTMAQVGIQQSYDLVSGKSRPSKA